MATFNSSKNDAQATIVALPNVNDFSFQAYLVLGVPSLVSCLNIFK